MFTFLANCDIIYLMNIFILNEDPVIAAQEQCDKHVVKMIVESAQMLSTAHRMLDGSMERRASKSGSMLKYYYLDTDLEDQLYKACHHNHPCSIWVRESSTNYVWLYDHFMALCREYTYRYNKKHMTQTKLQWLLQKLPKNIPVGLQTPFKLAMQNEPQCITDDTVESYHKYYLTKKDRFAMTWSKRQTPEWFNNANV